MMTVNELIKELQALANEGLGELNVCTIEECYICETEFVQIETDYDNCGDDPQHRVVVIY